MSGMLVLQLIVLLAAIALGSRMGGVGMGLWGGVGLILLIFVFGEAPGSIPGEVLLIILSVIMAASAMEAAGGIDYLVRIAAGIIRKNPKHVTIIAPVVAYFFTFLAGTGHIFYPLLPVIYEVAMKGRVRPERPIAVATIASQQAITASPVSAATAALIVVLGSHGIGLIQILAICIPSTLLGVIVAALVQTRIGVELDADPEYRRRIASGELKETETTADQVTALPPRAPLSAWLFMAGVMLVVLCGLFPRIRQVGSVPAAAPVATVPAKVVPAKITTLPAVAATDADPEGANPATTVPAVPTDPENADTPTTSPAIAPPAAPPPAAVPITVSMPMTIAVVMLAVAAIMLLVTKAPAAKIPTTKTCQAGITAVIGILGLAWLGDTFIAANKGPIIGGLSNMAEHYPASFAIGLFVTSMLLYSQAATTKTLMPLGLSLSVSPAALAGMFPAVNGYFFIPTYGTLIAAVNFDRSGTTRIGKYILNHSFMIPGLVSTIVAVSTGLIIGKLFF